MSAQATDCYCSAGPGPHKHTPPAVAALDGLAEIAAPGHPWTDSLRFGQHLAEAISASLDATAPLPPRPVPRAGSGPLYGIQFLRKEAVRLAIDSYRDTDRPGDSELLATAERLAEFIRTGNVTSREQEV